MKLGSKKRLQKRMAGFMAVVLVMSLMLPTVFKIETKAAERVFVHPGMLHTQEAFVKMRANVEKGIQPNLDTWNTLLSDGYSNTDKAPRAVETVIRGGTGSNYAQFYLDIRRAYQLALVYQISGSEAHGEEACEYLNAWSSTMTGISGNADRFLAAGIYGYELANAAEIMRNHPSFNQEAMEELLVNVFYPMNNQFLTYHNDAHFGNYWANWDLCNIASMMSIGIFADREDIYNQAMEYYRNGIGMGSIYNAMPFVFDDGTAQWQESCRDQGHTVFGIGLCGVICEMAWNQGDDIYGLSDNRFLKAAEYVARYNNGYDDLQFAEYERNAGQNGKSEYYTGISPATRGQIRPIYSMIYNHYVNRKGLTAPNVAKVLGIDTGNYVVEGVGNAGDELGWQTLTFANLSDREDEKFTQGNFENGIYRITSALTQKALVVDAEGKLASAKAGTKDEEWWKFENIGDGEYLITNTVTGKVMEIGEDCYLRGTTIVTGERTGEKNQRFAPLKNDTGDFRIVSTVNTYVMDIKDAQTADDTPVIQWKYHGGTCQRWNIERKSDLLVAFDFDDETSGFESEYVKATGSYSLKEHGNGKAVYLDGAASNYLTVTTKQNHSVLSGADEITVAFQMKPDSKEANWFFYAAPDEHKQVYQREKYVGILGNASGVLSAERYNNNGRRPAAAMAQTQTDSDGWCHVAVVYGKNDTVVYVNGIETARVGNAYSLADILGSNSVFYIGKANWGNGEYYKGLIDNYTVYGRALSQTEVTEEMLKSQIATDTLAEFTFDDTEKGFADSYAVAEGSYSLAAMDDGNALVLNGTSDYLKVTKNSGESLLRGLTEFTLSFDTKPDTKDGNWFFYAASDEVTQQYQRERYVGIFGNAKNQMSVERYNNQGKRPASASVSLKADTWQHVTVVCSETESVVYVDGVELSRQASSYALSDILGDNSILYIGKANWGTGEYYQGMLDNYKIVGRALSLAEVVANATK